MNREESTETYCIWFKDGEGRKESLSEDQMRKAAKRFGFDEEEVINTGETWIWANGVEPYNSPSAISEDICGGCFKEVRENKMTKFEEKKYRVTVTTTHKRIYYLDAGDWETAQDMVEEPYAYGLVENALDYFKPDAESESGEEFEVEEV